MSARNDRIVLWGLAASMVFAACGADEALPDSTSEDAEPTADATLPPPEDALPPPPPPPDAAPAIDAEPQPPDAELPVAPPALVEAAAAVRAAFAPWVEAGWVPAGSVALVHGEFVEYLNFGEVSSARPEPPTEDALYAIGSISKTLTGLLLAEAVERGALSLDTPLQSLLPDGVTSPIYGDKEIVLRHLTTHTSALPRDARDPTDMNAFFYETFSLEDLWAWLNGVELTRAPGAQVEYSNMAVAVLGQALAHEAETDFPSLLVDRVTGPLGLESTFLPLDPDRADRFVPGRSDEVEVEYMELSAAGPAGAIVSSIRDMARYIQIQTGVLETPLSEAVTRSQSPLQAAGENQHVGYNWFMQDEPHIVFHDGAVVGHTAYLLFQPETDLGVVFLNASSNYAVYPLGNYALATLLQAAAEAPEPPPEVTLPPESLDAYVGRYVLGLNVATFVVTRADDRLYFRVEGQQDALLYAEGDDAFHLRVVPAGVAFQRDADGRVMRCILRQNGAANRANRVED